MPICNLDNTDIRHGRFDRHNDGDTCHACQPRMHYALNVMFWSLVFIIIRIICVYTRHSHAATSASSPILHIPTMWWCTKLTITSALIICIQLIAITTSTFHKSFVHFITYLWTSTILVGARIWFWNFCVFIFRSFHFHVFYNTLHFSICLYNDHRSNTILCICVFCVCVFTAGYPLWRMCLIKTYVFVFAPRYAFLTVFVHIFCLHTHIHGEIE
jgi:hypothetical protein